MPDTTVDDALAGKVIFERGDGCFTIRFLSDPNSLTDQEWHRLFAYAQEMHAIIKTS